MKLPESYRKTIISKIAELLPGADKGNMDIARKLAIALAMKEPKSRNIPNKHFLEIFRKAATENGIKDSILLKLVDEFKSPPKPVKKHKYERRSIATTRIWKTRLPKSLDRETTLRYLQNAIDKNYAMCRKDGMNVKKYSAEQFLKDVKFQLAKKPYTNRDVVNAARALNRKELVVTPISVSNAVVDKLAKRADIRVTIISTPTRR